MIPASAHAGAAVPVDHEGLAVARGGLPLDGRSALFGRQRVDRVGDDGDLGRGGGAGQQRKHFLRPVPGPERREVHTHPCTVVVRPRRGHHRVGTTGWTVERTAEHPPVTSVTPKTRRAVVARPE